MAKKILVSGYYGYNNIGDEAILKGLIDGLSRESDGEIIVLSKNPDWTTEKYKVKSVNRSNIIEVIKAIKNSDIVLSGGGSLLQDVTSKKSIIYYLGILQLAMIFRKKTFIYSSGIGPIKLKRNIDFARWILNRVDFINVRDSQSKRQLREIGVNREVLVTTDTVFGIDKPNSSRGRQLLENLGVKDNKINICLTIINWKNYGNRTIEEINKTINILVKNKNLNIILVPFFYHVDLDIQNKIYENFKNEDNVFLLKEYLHVNDYLSLIGNMDIVLSMRLHGLIFASLMGAYPIGISYDPKIDGFMKELNRIQKFYVEDFNGEDIGKEILKSIDNLVDLKLSTKKHLDKFYNLAREHNKAVERVLKN